MRHFWIVVIAWGLSWGFSQELTVWTHLRGEALGWLEQEITSFSQNFNITVSLEQRDISDIRQQLLQQPENAADVILPMAHDQLDALLEQDTLLDFKPLSTETYLEGYAAQTRLAFQRGNQLFALPLYSEGAALIVNTELLPTAPENFAAFVASAQALSDEKHYGFLYDIGNFYFSYLWLRSAGAYVFARDATGTMQADAIGLATAGAVTGAEHLRQLRFDYQLIPAKGANSAVDSSVDSSVDYSFADQHFRTGKLAMIYNGPWALAAYKEAGIAMQVLPMPLPLSTEEAKQVAGFMSVYGVVVNAKGSQQLTAVDFAKWVARASSQSNLAQQTGYIPTRLAAAEAADDALVLGFARALLHAEPMPHIPEMAQVWAPMSEALSVLLECESMDSEAIEALLEQAVQYIKNE